MDIVRFFRRGSSLERDWAEGGRDACKEGARDGRRERGTNEESVS